MLSIIVAHDKNFVIGKDNDLPWNLPGDLSYFKKVTTGKTIIMGRKTFESIGKPLPSRRSVVLSRDAGFSPEGVLVLNDISELVSYKEDDKEHFLIGGAELFKELLPMIDKAYVTYIDESFSGDTFFYELNNKEWKLLSEEKGTKDMNNPYDYYFRTYSRIL